MDINPAEPEVVGPTRSQPTTSSQSSVVSNNGVTISLQQGRAAQRWLAWLGQLLVDVSWLVLIDTGLAKAEYAGKWPTDPTLPDGLTLLARQAANHHKPAELTNFTDTDIKVLAIPLPDLSGSGGSIPYVLMLGSAQFSGEQQRTLIRLCRWASSWLFGETHSDAAVSPVPMDTSASTCKAVSGIKSDATENTNQHSTAPLGSFFPENTNLASAMLDAMARHRNVKSVAYAVINAAVIEFGCRRVSMGLISGDKVKIIAVSGQSRIDARRVSVRQLTAAMQESISYKCTLVYPPLRDDVQLTAHANLFAHQGQHPTLSVRLPCDGKDKLVVLLERPTGNTFAAAQIAAIETMLAPAAPLVMLLQETDTALRQRFMQLVDKVKQVLRARDLSVRQLGVFTATALVLFAAFLPVPHKVTARAAIEAADRQVVAAPFAGYVQSSHARAGDRVVAGQVLATLDSRVLMLEADKWHSEQTKNEQEYAAALAIHDRTELTRLRADVVRIEAELALIDQQLSRSALRAPFNGVLLSGDLSQSLGALVQAGDVLFEIASADKYRLLLDIDERDVGFIIKGQVAEIRMASLPNRLWQAKLEDVLPVAVVEKGSSVFRLPASLLGEASALRPGMQGIAKVHTGSRSLLWVYTHTLFDRFGLLLWKFGLLS